LTGIGSIPPENRDTNTPTKLPTTLPANHPDTSKNRRTTAQAKTRLMAVFIDENERRRTRADARLVPLAGIEPALLAELDFESSASTNSATGAFAASPETTEVAKPAEYSGR
jgi:hypothetical protein